MGIAFLFFTGVFMLIAALEIGILLNGYSYQQLENDSAKGRTETIAMFESKNDC
jgi:hypothetical protein